MELSCQMQLMTYELYQIIFKQSLKYFVFDDSQFSYYVQSYKKLWKEMAIRDKKIKNEPYGEQIKVPVI